MGEIKDYKDESEGLVTSEESVDLDKEEFSKVKIDRQVT